MQMPLVDAASYKNSRVGVYPRSMKYLVLLALCAGLLTTRADGLDDLIARLLGERQIVGLSVAIVENGKIVKAEGYGFADRESQTFASDLARFEIAIQQTIAGKSNRVTSQTMGRQMFTRQKENAGLGLFLQWEDKNLVFMQNG